MKKSVLIIFLFLTIQSFSQSSISQQIRYAADSIRKWRRVPALAYAVFTADTVIHMGGVGYKRIRAKDTISLKSRFHLGPATISLTSFIAAQAIMKGKLKWNTTVFEVFPELRETANKEYGNPTLVDLLTQRSGLWVCNNYTQLSTVPGFPGTAVQKRRETVEWLFQQKKTKRDTSAINRFIYTNANGIVAAAMIEKRTGKSWESLLSSYVNKPLRMSVKTGFPNRADGNQPWGHWTEGGRFNALGPDHWFGLNPALAPAADANMSVADYVKFVQDQLRGLRGKKAVLPPRVYETMHYGFPLYSLGWTNVSFDNYHISESDGTFGTFYSHVEIIKEKNIAVIVMCNSGDSSAKGAVLNLARMIREMFITL